MGWVYLFLLLPLGSASAQLWEWGRVEEDRPWEPDRKPKSLAFLNTKETEIQGNRVDSGQMTKDKKKAKLNVSDKDSPYALIDKYFPERESYFYQNKDKFVDEYRSQETKTDIGNIHPSEVWLADDNLLVLKGGSTKDRAGWDNPWEPLDDFQAPYREPVLPPLDFDPDSLEIGVGVDIETILAQRAREKELKQSEKDVKEHFIPDVKKHFIPDVKKHFIPETIPDIPPLIDPDNALRPFKEEVLHTHQEEFKAFFNDVSQFISDMENFHSARKVIPQREVDQPLFKEYPPKSDNSSSSVSFKSHTAGDTAAKLPSNDSPTSFSRSAPFTSFPRNAEHTSKSKENSQAPTILKEVHHSSTIQVLPKSFREPPTTTPEPQEITPAWQHDTETERNPTFKPTATERPTSEPATSYPLSYSSPHSKVYLSTHYVTHAPSPTPSQSSSPSHSRTNHARSSHRLAPAPTQDQSRSFSFKPVKTSAPAPVRIFRPRSTTTPPRTEKTTSRTTVPPRHDYRSTYHDTGEQEDWRPVTPPPVRQFNPAPTPYSLFQSVPENIGETDVFHLSQNVNFGKKIESGSGGYLNNEVDTGSRRNSKHFSPPKLVSTRSPRLVSPKARQGLQRGGGGFLPSFGAPPAKKNRTPSPHKGRGRSSIRRRRPKAVSQTPVDRSSSGDVRYVSFYSGGAGGNSWGYSYNLG